MKKINYRVPLIIKVLKTGICTVFAFALVTNISSCKKNSDTPEEAVMNLDKNGLDYVNLPAGKYYIYKDSASGELDSVVITRSTLESFHIPANYEGDPSTSHPAFTYQSLTLVISKLKPAPREDWINATTPQPGYPFNTDSAEIFLQASDYSLAFIYPLLFSNAVLIPGLTVENKEYDNVIEYTDGNGFSIDNPLYKKRIYYWAKNIGLIKFVTITTGNVAKVYTLIRNS